MAPADVLDLARVPALVPALADPEAQVAPAHAVPCIRRARTPEVLRRDPVHAPASVRVLALLDLADVPALADLARVVRVWPLREHPEQPSLACVRPRVRVQPTRSVTKRAKKAQ